MILWEHDIIIHFETQTQSKTKHAVTKMYT